jgi:hypothetical protein
MLLVLSYLWCACPAVMLSHAVTLTNHVAGAVISVMCLSWCDAVTCCSLNQIMLLVLSYLWCSCPAVMLSHAVTLTKSCCWCWSYLWCSCPAVMLSHAVALTNHVAGAFISVMFLSCSDAVTCCSLNQSCCWCFYICDVPVLQWCCHML